MAPFAPLAVIGKWKCQGTSGAIVHKITPALGGAFPLQQAGGDLTIYATLDITFRWESVKEISHIKASKFL